MSIQPEVERATQQHRIDEVRRERVEKTRQSAQTFVEGIKVPAGEMFILRTEERDENGKRYTVDAILTAQRDLGAQEYLDVLDGAREGLVNVVNLPVHDNHMLTRSKLRSALLIVEQFAEDDMRPVCAS